MSTSTRSDSSGPAPDDDRGLHRLKAGSLAAMWRTYRAAGATHLIATGPVESEAVLQTYLRVLPTASVTVCRLHAGPIDPTQRIMSRRDGGSWPQPGDPLRGQAAGYLRRVAHQAIADDRALERAGVGTARVDTTGRSVDQAVDLIASVTGWPSAGRGQDAQERARLVEDRRLRPADVAAGCRRCAGG